MNSQQAREQDVKDSAPSQTLTPGSTWRNRNGDIATVLVKVGSRLYISVYSEKLVDKEWFAKFEEVNP